MIAACKYKVLKDTPLNDDGVVPIYFYAVNGNQILDVLHNGESLQADHTVDESESRVDFEFALGRADELMVIYTTLPRLETEDEMADFASEDFSSDDFF
jgi:hypothetical protein